MLRLSKTHNREQRSWKRSLGICKDRQGAEPRLH